MVDAGEDELARAGAPRCADHVDADCGLVLGERRDDPEHAVDAVAAAVPASRSLRSATTVSVAPARLAAWALAGSRTSPRTSTPRLSSSGTTSPAAAPAAPIARTFIALPA